ncbi:unnamed protein product [Rotaria sp. Silwood1]|nr:unnamed protein product [Rotaria sp. Silwood1]CAF4064438.1 unnamed protein product [Rotaria sp. Silwood1]CAF5026228.1 unnamed protein product [Rotaria sp. Silwood1]
MSHPVKKTILSIIPLYVSKESQAYGELTAAITAISDEKFGEIINQKPSSVGHRIHELLDDTIFFLNQHYGINEEQGSKLDQLMNQIKHICLDVMHNNELMGNEISILEDRIQHVENKQNTSNKLRTMAELLTPIVKDIRNSMINQQISDNYS